MRPVILALLLFGPLAAAPARVRNLRGKVVAVNAEKGWFGLVPDRDPGTRYAPDPALPEAFRRDGLRVVFSGRVKPSPEGVRQWGTPLEVTRIIPEGPRK
jgi:hypothetical protein